MTTVVNPSMTQAQIQAVMNPGGVVDFEPGTYDCATRYWMRNNLHIRALEGKGSVILRAVSGIDTGVLGNPNTAGTTHIRNFRASGIIFDGNGVNQPGQQAKICVALDPLEDSLFEDCAFINARGYGVGLQYLANGIPDNERCRFIDFLRCDFDYNGMGIDPAYGTVALYDGADVKCGRSILFDRCRARNNFMDGFDVRGHAILRDIEATDNGGAGVEISANANGHNQDSSLTVYGGLYARNNRGLGIANNPAGGTGSTVVEAYGPRFEDNVTDGVFFFVSNAKTRARIRATAHGNGGLAVKYAGQPLFKDVVVTPI